MKTSDTVPATINYLSGVTRCCPQINLKSYARLKNACDLWRNSNLITEIAFAVGFQSHSQFNRVFRIIFRQVANAIPRR